MGHRLDCSASGQGEVANCCEFGNVTSGTRKFGELLDWLRAC